jgi:hypothetical protein
MTMTTRCTFRFAVSLVAALCFGVMAATPSAATAPHGRDQGQARSKPTQRQLAQLKTSPPPSGASTSSGATKPDDETAPKKDHAASSGDSTAAPSPAHAGHGAKKTVEDEHPDRDHANKGKRPSAKGPATPDVHMKDLGPVDTRITVSPEPHRAGDKRLNPLPHSPMGQRILPPHNRPPGAPPKRNSIGEAFPSPVQPAARTPSHESSPGAASPGIAARGGEGPGNTAAVPGSAAVAPLHPHPITAAPAVPRSTINGSSITRRSNLPAGIGGQAKPVSGINGSEIRPKH